MGLQDDWQDPSEDNEEYGDIFELPGTRARAVSEFKDREVSPSPIAPETNTGLTHISEPHI